MNRKGIALTLALGLLVASCGSEDEVDQLPEAPKRRPMALDPNPPMSGADIDAIVSQKTRSASAAAPGADTGNTSDAKGN